MASVYSGILHSELLQEEDRMNQLKEEEVVGFLERRKTCCVSLCGVVLK
jgi:hypothetical protein